MNKGMKNHVMKAAACFATGSMLLSGSGVTAFAAGSSLVGVEALKSTAEVEENSAESTEEAVQETVEDEQEEVQETEEAVVEEVSMVGTMGVAYPGDEGCFNIRAEAALDSDVVGYLYDGNFASIIDEEGDWYKIQSGNCVGYVAKYLLTTGEAANQAIEESATAVAQVNAEGLMVRSEASEDGEILDMVTEDQIVYLEEDLGGWAKVSTGETTGYVNADYVSYATYLPQAETQEEAQARIEQEEAEYAAWVAQQEAEYAAWLEEQERLYLEELAAQQAEWEAQNQAWIEYLESQGQYADEAAQAAEDAAANQAYAEQVYEEANQALSEAYDTGDVEIIAQAEEEAANAAVVVEEATVAASEAAAEAEAADQAVYDTVADAGIDTSDVTDAEGDSGSSTTSSTRQAVVDYALQFVGNPYVYGGTSLTNGTDCSGFTQSVLSNFGINISRTAGQQSLGGTKVSLDAIQPGDLLFYNGSGDYGIGHVSMYIGDGQVVHASSSTTGIIVSDINYRTPSSASSYINE